MLHIPRHPCLGQATPHCHSRSLTGSGAHSINHWLPRHHLRASGTQPSSPLLSSFLAGLLVPSIHTASRAKLSSWYNPTERYQPLQTTSLCPQRPAIIDHGGRYAMTGTPMSPTRLSYLSRGSPGIDHPLEYIFNTTFFLIKTST